MSREGKSREGRLTRHHRVRSTVTGDSERLRLCVFRSARHVYGQVIDDTKGHTLASASSLDELVRRGSSKKTKIENSKMVGTLVAQRALEKGVKKVVLDRGGYKYHGRVRALAEAAREGGLDF